MFFDPLNNSMGCSQFISWGRGVGGYSPHVRTPSEWLIFSDKHPPVLAHRRALLIISRARMLGFQFGIFTPLWGIIDCVIFSWPFCGVLVSMRLLFSAVITALIWSARNASGMRDAYLALLLLFAVPSVFFLAFCQVLMPYQFAGLAGMLGSAHIYIPFVLLAGLSIFPLTIAENLMVAVLVLVVQAIQNLLHLTILHTSILAQTYWVLGLVVVGSMLAGISQLNALVASVVPRDFSPFSKTSSMAKS